MDMSIRTKRIVAIMVKLDGTWYPYKLYNNDRAKTRKNALNYMRSHGLGKVSPFRPLFKIDNIWIIDEEEEKVQVYVKKKEIRISLGQDSNKES